jgi:hypothetical protein
MRLERRRRRWRLCALSRGMGDDGGGDGGDLVAE